LALILRGSENHRGGLEMKSFIGALVLSLVSAFVGIFAATELHEISCDDEGVDAARQATRSDTSHPSQKIQQWVNY
jgi:hypothetical protein